MRPRPVVLLWIAVAACGGSPGPGSAAPVGRAERFGAVQLVLNNRHWLDVVVRVEHDGETTRIGQVAAASSGRFSVPAWAMGSSGYVRFVADPVGSPVRSASDWVNVWGGQTVEWTLESQLDRSSMLVY
jgi:hypothetical protein